MRYFLYAVWLIIILLGIVFASLNSTQVTLHYYINTLKVSLSFLLFCTLMLGFILGSLTLLPSIIKSKIKNKTLKKNIKSLEKEIKNLRAIPFTDQRR